MTERGRQRLACSTERLAIGASTLQWAGDALEITIAERAFPRMSTLHGTVVVRPPAISEAVFDLDGQGRHWWRPVCPACDVDVHFASPELRWRGRGYFDTNGGSEPLEDSFRSWRWTRFDLGDHSRIFYDATLKDGTDRPLALRVDARGAVSSAEPLPYHALGRSLWGLSRRVPGETAEDVGFVRKLEDAPFYSRSAIRSRVGGRLVEGVNEHLSLPRLTSPLVRAMLPFRMPRVAT